MPNLETTIQPLTASYSRMLLGLLLTRGSPGIARTETIAGCVSHLSIAAKGTARGCSRRAVERAATGVMAYLPGQLPALEFASQAGFVVKGYARDLRLPAQTPRVPATLPSGWRLEPYSESLDVARYARVLDASHADLCGHGIATSEVVQTMLSTLDPRDVFLVVDGAGLDVGCAGVTRGVSQSIDAPGLIQTHRSPENYQSVLATALNYLELNSDVLLHSWGDQAETVAAYTALGFVETECTAMAWRGI